MEAITKPLCEFIFTLKYENLPKEVIETTKLFIADYYASCYAGYFVNYDFNLSNLKMIKLFGGNEEASILFSTDKFSIEQAAFMNSLYAHGADLDDGNSKSAGHIGASVISAVFALGEYITANWRNIILAINIGYEVFNRIGEAVQPSLYNKGFHSTGIIGGIAAAAACAKLLNLNIKEIYDAISLSALQSNGFLLIDESGQNCKPLNPANAARIGVQSAILAKIGINTPDNPLESSKGWINTFANMVKKEAIFKDIGKRFTICESYLKLYPSCRHTHSCIEAAIEIRKNINVNTIKYVKVFTYSHAIKSAGNIKIPSTKEDAKFSISYAVAIALSKGGFGIEALEVKRTLDKNVLSLLNKIEIVNDDTLENVEKRIRGARILVELINGEKYEKTVKLPRGEGKNILKWSDIEGKIAKCAMFAKDSSYKEIIKNCRNINMESQFISILSIVDKKI